MSNDEKTITIIGAGLVGSLLAMILQQRGYQVTMFERYQDIRSIPSLGRSINLVLTSRGLRAVNLLGPALMKEVMQLCQPVMGRTLHQPDGQIQYQPYGKDESECNYSISRFELNKFLLDKAAKAGATIHFNTKVNKYDFDTNTLHLEKGATPTKAGTKSTFKAGRVVGADGGGSAIRYAMRDAKFTDFGEEMLSHGYKEMIFPKNTSGSMDVKGLHIWPRGDHMLMGLLNLDGSWTGTIYLAKEGPRSFKELNTKESVARFFEQYYADAIPLLGGIQSVTDQFISNPVGILGTVRAKKYNADGKALLVGDAAHAIVPFFGQGTNCGFEDCFKFAQLLDQTQDWGVLFERFDHERRANGDAIADMALDNFVEMCDRVGDQRFLLQKQVENIIENKWPERYRSRYAMVCYGGLGNVSYSAAQQLGEKNYEILGELLQGLKKAEDVDLAKASKLIDEKLLPLQKKLRINLATVSHDLDVLTAAKL